jgi:hypothetical protein
VVAAVPSSERIWRKKALALLFVLVSISAVVVEGCGNPACTQVDVRYTLAPHSSIKELGQPDGAVRPWKILTISGSTLGCLPFRFTKRFSSDPAFGASMHVPCGSDGGVGAIGKADWPGA